MTVSCCRFPAGHRFPMQKYRLLRERVESELRDVVLHEAPAASDAELTRVHCAGYVERVATGALDAREQREIGFPWSREMVERSRRSVGATIAACRAARADGFAVNLAGGTHHSYAAHGAGFCVFNDAAVAARVMQAEAREKGGREQVSIVDLDVHQGNGTASIFRDDPSVFSSRCTASPTIRSRRKRAISMSRCPTAATTMPMPTPCRARSKRCSSAATGARHLPGGR